MPKDGIRLNDVDKLIVKARLDGKSFCQLEGDLLLTSTDQIMIRGAAVTGCALPSTDFFARAISDEITVFINEYGYEYLTVEEILTAMRLNANGVLKWPSGMEIEYVPFSGKTFNVDFLARVLKNYKALRDNLDRRFQNFIDGHE